MLAIATYFKSDKCFEHMINNSEYAEQVNYNGGPTGCTALHLAAAQGNIGYVEELINHQANCNVQDDSGDTPLSLAVKGGHIDVVKVLLGEEMNVEGKLTYLKAGKTWDQESDEDKEYFEWLVLERSQTQGSSVQASPRSPIGHRKTCPTCGNPKSPGSLGRATGLESSVRLRPWRRV